MKILWWSLQPPLSNLAIKRALSFLNADHRAGGPDRKVDTGGNQRSEDRRDDEQPELTQSPSTNKDRRSDAARRIDRRVRYRDTHQMDEREHQADRNTGKTDRRLDIRCAKDCKHQEECENCLRQKC